MTAVAFLSRRESFTEGPNLSPMPHSVLSRRRELFEEKADEACELRRQGVARLQFYTGEAKEFLGSFQSLEDQFNGMVRSHVPHPAPLEELLWHSSASLPPSSFLSSFFLSRLRLTCTMRAAAIGGMQSRMCVLHCRWRA